MHLPTLVLLLHQTLLRKHRTGKCSRDEERVSENGQSRYPLIYTLALLLQDFAYSYRVWITLIKLPYALLRYLKIDLNIHQEEKLYGRLLPSVPRVSEKNSKWKPAYLRHGTVQKAAGIASTLFRLSPIRTIPPTPHLPHHPHRQGHTNAIHRMT